jgi:hypothetical protein
MTEKEFSMFRHIAIAATLAITAPAAFAQDAATQQPQAQTQPTQVDPAAAYQAARNQLGILKYCQTQGFSGAEAVAAQEKLVGMLPAGDEGVGAQAEQKGTAGTVSVGQTEISLEDAAARQGTTVESQCQQIEAAVKQVAQQLPAG